MAAKTKKTSAAKKTPKAPALPATTVAPVVPAVSGVKPATPATSMAKPTVSTSERAKMIEVAAYLLAEKNGFRGDAKAYWLQAERDVDAKLGKK